MKLDLLLINPWIYDFAAVNLWSQPLGLFSVAEHLQRYDVSVSILDCMDSYIPKRFGIGQYHKETVEKPECLKPLKRRYSRYGIGLDNFRHNLSSRRRPDAVFVTSIMSYWYPGVQKAIELVRDIYGKVPVLLGGIYATLWHGHASETSGADFIYRGPISDDISFALNTFGFRFRKNRRPKDRPVISFSGRYPFAAIQTSSGCPFSCSYCGSGLLNSRFIQRNSDEVVRETTALADSGIRDFAFYDDALLFDSETHIKPILREIAARKLNIRLHSPNGLHARYIDDELAYLMKKSGFTTIRLSLETVDTERQRHTGNKVDTGHLSDAVALMKKKGFRKEDIGVYLMYGLPGQGLDEVKAGVEFLKGLGVKINLTEFSPIPGTPCCDELVRNNVITEDIDPLLTNNTVFSTLFSGYDPDEVKRMRLDVKKYNALGPSGKL